MDEKTIKRLFSELDIEILEANANVIATQSMLALLVPWIARSESDKELLLEALDQFPKNVENATFPASGPELSDLYAGLLQDAYDDLASLLKARLSN